MKITFLFIFIFSAIHLHAQIQKNDKPFILVGNYETDMNSLVLDPSKIDSVNVLKGENAIATYGRIATNGAVIIYPKRSVNLLTINKIFEKYNLSATDRGLRVAINKTVLPDANMIVIDESEIISVEITTDVRWTNSDNANSGEKFIKINTRSKTSEAKLGKVF